MDERLEEILIRCMTGKATDSELNEAFAWISSSKSNRAEFESLYSAWLASGLTSEIDPASLQRVWDSIQQQKTPGNKKSLQHDTGKRSIVVQIFKIAAMIILTFSLGFAVRSFFSSPQETHELYTVEAPRGAKSHVQMADGTLVWLNAGSSIKYSNDFNRKSRDLYLSGEAYFEVAKNKEKNFRVFAGGIVIQALGTAFNVKAYPDEGQVETTLVEGKIRIEKEGREGKWEPVLLEPDQQAIYVRDIEELNLATIQPDDQAEDIKPGGISVDQKVKTEIFTSWKDKRWVFSSEKFGDFARELERIYDTRIVIADPEISNYKLSGSIEKENIEMVLQALQLIIPINYEIHHKEVHITMNRDLKAKYDAMMHKNSAN